MKIILAPDSFKGSLSALEAATLLREAAEAIFPGVETELTPVADGGEGTVDALMSSGGLRRDEVMVTGPMGNPVAAEIGWLDSRTAIIEMAQASGLPLVDLGARDPMAATSRGTGELIAQAIERGAKRLLIGIGGSATNDGGCGLLSALGVRFLTPDGAVVPDGGAGLARVAAVDMGGLNPMIGEVDMTVICDVTNPLTGPNGATYVYGPQKGVTPDMAVALDAGMANYAAVMERALGRGISDFPGAGAAGGVGAALGGVLGASMRPGIDAVLEAVAFDEKLEGAALCVTGEGRIDDQSILYGKAVAGIAVRCAAAGVPVIAIVGGMGDGSRELYNIAEASIMTTVNAPMTIECAMSRARELFISAAERAFRLVKIGMGVRA